MVAKEIGGFGFSILPKGQIHAHSTMVDQRRAEL